MAGEKGAAESKQRMSELDDKIKDLKERRSLRMKEIRAELDFFNDTMALAISSEGGKNPALRPHDPRSSPHYILMIQAHNADSKRLSELSEALMLEYTRAKESAAATKQSASQPAAAEKK